MFGWFRAKRRAIFGYHDGRRRRWADPVAVHQKLEQAGGPDWGETFGKSVAVVPSAADPRQVAALKASREESARQVVGWARHALEIPAFDGTGRRPIGLTDSETMEVFVRFLDFCRQLNESAAPFAKRSPRESPSPATA